MTAFEKNTARSTDWWRSSLIVLCGLLVAFQVGKLPVSLLSLRADLGLSLVSAAWVISIFHIVALTCGIFAGRIADHIGHRRIVLTSLIWIAICSAAGTFSQSGTAILVSRVGEGVGAILILVSAPALIVGFTGPSDRPLVMAVWGAWMPLGSGLMILLSPFILQPFGWRGVWVANGLLLLACAGLFAFATRDMTTTAATGGQPLSLRALWSGIRLTVTSKGPLLLAAMAMIVAALFASVFSFLPTFLVEIGRQSLAQAAVLTGVATLVGAIGSVICGWVLSRGTALWVVLILSSLLLAIVGYRIFMSGLSFGERYAHCAAYFICTTIAFATLWNYVPLVAPSSTLVGTTVGLWMQGSNLGALLGPPCAAALVSAISWRTVSWLVIGLSIAAVVVSLLLRPVEKAGRARRDI